MFNVDTGNLDAYLQGYLGGLLTALAYITYRLARYGVK
jgi:hypothetical protein